MRGEVNAVEVLRFIALCLLAFNLGAMAVIARLYYIRAGVEPWWARLLPSHVWRVVVASLIFMASQVGVLIHLEREQAGLMWWAAPTITAGNIMLLWGLIFMIRWQAAKRRSEGLPGYRRKSDRNPPGYRRKDDPEPKEN